MARRKREFVRLVHCHTFARSSQSRAHAFKKGWRMFSVFFQPRFSLATKEFLALAMMIGAASWKAFSPYPCCFIPFYESLSLSKWILWAPQKETWYTRTDRLLYVRIRISMHVLIRNSRDLSGRMYNVGNESNSSGKVLVRIAMPMSTYVCISFVCKRTQGWKVYSTYKCSKSIVVAEPLI